MIRRVGKNLGLFVGEPPEAAVALERDGYALLPSAFSPTEVAELAAEIDAGFAARAGDVAPFVSDVWHRGTPAGPDGPGRSFLQCHYGLRDIAQRLRTTADAHQLSAEAVSRAETERERALVGLHDPFFYDG